MNEVGRARFQGISLMELMVVVVILAVIGAVAIPSYTSQVRTANRIDAKRILMQLQSTYERFYAENSSVYPTVGISGAYSALSLGTAPSSSYYTFAVTTMGGNSAYTLTATAISTQLGDTDCRRFTIDNLGNRAAFNSGGTLNNLCW